MFIFKLYICFTLSNAVSAFQRMMEEVLEGVTNSIPYIYDILTHSKTFESHLVDLVLLSGTVGVARTRF